MSLPVQFARALQRTTLLMPMRLPLAGPSVRLMSKRECAKDETPRCGKENLKKSPCAIAKAKEAAKKKPVSPFKSLWENPECCRDPCPDVFPRFDELYYKMTDKAKRVYKQTWVECPDKKIVKKPICDYKNLKYPKLEKRPRKARPKTACAGSGDKLLMSCNKKADIKCIKITLPGCRGVRDPPKCKKERGPSDCKKVCCPYPSFSECTRKRPKPRHPVECNCLRILSMCDVWAELRRRMTIKK